ncbi:DEAD/DEAH box helicase [Bartonella queenslandensis]|uniref:DEAD/DEAH box helicase n=1 Tax=Bartonella queenslandensis TaxID=481138 RepID=UPI0003138EE8|nr:DEAD/DEAH box helicase [Bartonella queenslandensis]
MLLRPRQKELVSKTVDALYMHGNTLAVAPTGAGKTIMLSAVLGRMFERDIQHACVLAHRDELTFQNETKFRRVNPGLSTSIFNANKKSWNGDVTFAMVQTLARESNLQSLPPLDALVIDEAHHARADSYMRVIEAAQQRNPNMKLLGMTATPNRGDKKGLRPIFSNVADQITVRELIASGHLVPPRTFVMNVGVQEELSKVRKTALDYDMGAVADILNTRPINEAVVQHWREKAGDRQTVVFCSTIKHARDVMLCFHQAGIATAMIWGEMSEQERLQTLDAYSKGDVQVVVNVAVLTEGWDHPPTSCIVLLRPSSYKSTMIQMIGRGLRTIDPAEFPSIIKKDCIVLDFGTSTLMHGSLEQEVELDDCHIKGDAPYKNCPDCGAQVPLASKECSLCGHVWESFNEAAITQTAQFQMSEIDILQRSSFLWCDLRGDEQYFIAAGFEAWGGVFNRDGVWYAVGGRKSHPVQLLAAGERLVCFAAADDWINLFETESDAHKTKAWLHQPATEKQLNRLPAQYRNDYSLTRYKASALMTMQFNHRAIRQAIETGRITA